MRSAEYLASSCFLHSARSKNSASNSPIKTFVLAYFSTTRYCYAFAFSKDQYAHWQLGSTSRVQAEVGKFLRLIGNADRNIGIDEKQLEDTTWKEASRQLFQKLSNNVAADTWDRYDKLVIVPDGVLWYVPFAALHVGDQPLLSKVQIRHAPTVSMIPPDGLPSRPNQRSAIAVTKMFVSDDEQIGEAGFQQIAGALPDIVKLPTPLPTGTATTASVIDRLVILGNSDDMYIRTPLAWAPLPQGRKRARSAIDDWLRLPFGAPEQIVMPSYHTAAESGLKRGGAGHEMFMAVCGLMASGSRTIALSRWQTGGQSCYDLVKELTQELPNRSASSALKRAVQVVMNNPLDADAEPRVKKLKAANAFKTDHPFFWSGFLIIDSVQRK